MFAYVKIIWRWLIQRGKRVANKQKNTGKRVATSKAYSSWANDM